MYSRHMHVEVFKKELAWAIDKRLQVISNIKQLCTTKELKNKGVISLKQYWMCCYVELI